MNKRLIALIGLILMFVFVAGCNGEVVDEEKDSDVIIPPLDYNLNEKFAVDALNPTINYNVTGNLVELGDNAEYIRILGSNLIKYDSKETYNTQLIYNYKTDRVVSEPIDKSVRLYSENNYEYSAIVTNSKYPLIVYVTYDELNAKYITNYADAYGRILIQKDYIINERLYITGKYEIDMTGYFYVNNITSKEILYFKFLIDDATKEYAVNVITEEAYNNVDTKIPTSDGYKKIYDSKGDIIGYTKTFWLRHIFFYDKNYNYLNNVNLDSYGFNSISEEFRTEKEVYYVNRREYRMSSSYYGPIKYQITLLKVDLTTGEITFDNDFRYVILDSSTINKDDKFLVSAVTFSELNEDNEISGIIKTAFFTDEFSLNEYTIGDALATRSYKLSDDTLLVYYNDVYHIVRSDSVDIVNGLTILSISDGNILYMDNSNYYLSSYNEFISAFNNLENPKRFISTYTNNGKRVSYIYDQQEAVFVMDDSNFKIIYNYIELAKKGIYVTEEKLYINDELLISEEGSSIISVTPIINIEPTEYIYRVSLRNNLTYEITYQYFYYNQKIILEDN